MWVKTLSRRITLLTEWMIHKGYDRVSERLGPEFFVRGHKSENSIVTTDVYWDDAEIKEKAELIEKKYDENKDFLRNLAKTCYSYCDSVISESYRIGKMDLAKESNESLLDLFRTYVDKFNDLDVVMFIIFPTETFLTQRALKGLRETFNGEVESKIQEYFGTLTVLPKESEAFLEQIDLLEISAIPKDDETIKRIGEHAIRFGWMGVSDNSFLVDPWKSDYFIERIKEIESPAEKLKILTTNREKELENYKKFIKGLDKNLVEDAEILQDFIYLRTYRITALKKAQINIKPLIKEIAKRFDLTFEDIVWFKPDEIESLLISGKVPDFEGRKKGYAVIRENGIVRIENIENHEEVKASNILRGVAANKGKAEGIVKIICNAKEADKMKEGNILVTKMTVPDMIMAIEKAAAIVTDEGGITSHAVIISRELGKPCVIATKIATKVLKDGDRVRVDAENGVIEKLSG
jgi:phosphoenolpyruvate synthase/pyruvate phosphate dikinase